MGKQKGAVGVSGGFQNRDRKMWVDVRRFGTRKAENWRFGDLNCPSSWLESVKFPSTGKGRAKEMQSEGVDESRLEDRGAV